MVHLRRRVNERGARRACRITDVTRLILGWLEVTPHSESQRIRSIAVTLLDDILSLAPVY